MIYSFVEAGSRSVYTFKRSQWSSILKSSYLLKETLEQAFHATECIWRDDSLNVFPSPYVAIGMKGPHILVPRCVAVRSLMFSLSTAPWSFNTSVRKLQVLAHCHRYLYFYRWAHNQASIFGNAVTPGSMPIDLCHKIGYKLHAKKSGLPLKQAMFVGYWFQTISLFVLPTEECPKFNVIMRWFSGNHRITLEQVAISSSFWWLRLK